jgi:hypothetical protein
MTLSNAGDVMLTSSSKGLTQEMVTTATAVTSTMQIVEYHVEYNTTTDHLKQTTIVVGGKVTLRKKRITIVVTSPTLRIQCGFC